MQVQEPNLCGFKERQREAKREAQRYIKRERVGQDAFQASTGRLVAVRLSEPVYLSVPLEFLSIHLKFIVPYQDEIWYNRTTQVISVQLSNISIIHQEIISNTISTWVKAD